MRRTMPLHYRGMLLLGSALLVGEGCSPRDSSFDAANAAAAADDAPLAFTVLSARSTRQLATSTLERKQATPGNRFVVLDVSVRNPGADPQVLLEGKLIAMSESGVQTFDTPVTLLSDDYLSVQVLPPGQNVRGKVAFEVPEHLPGVLYWSPGSDGKRILLHPDASYGEQRTLADAGFDDAIPSSIGKRTDIARRAPVQTLVSRPTPSGAAASRNDRILAPLQIANAALSPSIRQVATAPAASSRPDATTAAVGTAAGIGNAASLREPPALLPPDVAIPASQSPMDRFVARWVPPTTPTTGTDAGDESIRQLACQGLVARNDPSEKAGNLEFFNTACRDYPMPSGWAPGARRSLIGQMRTAMAGHAPACDSASRTSRLVCRDAVLSAMDMQLDRSVQRAGRYIGPIALQREQEQWTARVRDACRTIDCLRQAYRRQQARIEALFPAKN